MADYGRLLAMNFGQASAWISEHISAKMRGRWVAAMLDLAITDYYSANQALPGTLGRRFELASELLQISDTENLMSEADRAVWCMRFARKGREDGLLRVPSNLNVDATVRRTLACFKLSPEDAIAAATARRARYAEVIDGLSPGDRLLAVPPGVDDKDLLRIEALLPDLLWFANSIDDPGLFAEVQIWFADSAKLKLGEDISRAFRSGDDRPRG